MVSASPITPAAAIAQAIGCTLQAGSSNGQTKGAHLKLAFRLCDALDVALGSDRRADVAQPLSDAPAIDVEMEDAPPYESEAAIDVAMPDVVPEVTMSDAASGPARPAGSSSSPASAPVRLASSSSSSGAVTAACSGAARETTAYAIPMEPATARAAFGAFARPVHGCLDVGAPRISSAGAPLATGMKHTGSNYSDLDVVMGSGEQGVSTAAAYSGAAREATAHAMPEEPAAAGAALFAPATTALGCQELSAPLISSASAPVVAGVTRTGSCGSVPDVVSMSSGEHGPATAKSGAPVGKPPVQRGPQGVEAAASRQPAGNWRALAPAPPMSTEGDLSLHCRASGTAHFSGPPRDLQRPSPARGSGVLNAYAGLGVLDPSTSSSSAALQPARPARALPLHRKPPGLDDPAGVLIGPADPIAVDPADLATGSSSGSQAVLPGEQRSSPRKRRSRSPKRAARAVVAPAHTNPSGTERLPQEFPLIPRAPAWGAPSGPDIVGPEKPTCVRFEVDPAHPVDASLRRFLCPCGTKGLRQGNLKQHVTSKHPSAPGYSYPQFARGGKTPLARKEVELLAKVEGVRFGKADLPGKFTCGRCGAECGGEEALAHASACAGVGGAGACVALFPDSTFLLRGCTEQSAGPCIDRLLFGDGVPSRQPGILRVVSLNAQSLQNKGFRVGAYMEHHGANLVAIQETWAKPVEETHGTDGPPVTVVMEGYGFSRVASVPRVDGYGGLEWYADAFWRSRVVVADLPFAPGAKRPARTTDCQHSALRLAIPGRSFHLMSVYSPRGELPTVHPPSGDCIFVGDINAHHESWSSASTPAGAHWMEWFSTNSLEVCSGGLGPTRPASGSSPDVIARRAADSAAPFSTEVRLGRVDGPDHLPLVVDIDFDLPWVSGGSTGDDMDVDGSPPPSGPDADGGGGPDDPAGSSRGPLVGRQATASQKQRKSRQRKKPAAKKKGGAAKSQPAKVWLFQKANWDAFKIALACFFALSAVAWVCKGCASPPAEALEALEDDTPSWLLSEIARFSGSAPTPAQALNLHERTVREGILHAARTAVPRATVRLRRRAKRGLPPELENALAAARLGAPGAKKAVQRVERAERAKLLVDEVNRTDWSESGLAKGWALVRKFAGLPPKRGTESRCLLAGGRVVAGEREKGEELAKHYTSHPLLPAEKRAECLEEFRTNLRANQGPDPPPLEITAGEVLAGCRAAKGSGPDGVHGVMLRNIGPTGRTHVRLLCNASYRCGVCPVEWRKAWIVPVLKPGKLGHAAKEYRPVARTSVLSRVAEKGPARALCRAAPPPPEEIGFRPGRGTVDAAATLASVTESEIRRGRKVLAVAVDFSAAFDRVPVELFLREMSKESLLIGPDALRWLGSFLSGRKLSVLVGSSLSGPRDVLQGCPQGSVIGPVVWKCFLRSLLPSLAGVDHLVYADDLLLCAAYGSEAEREVATAKIQGALDRTLEWAQQSNMEVSEEKTQAIVFQADKPAAASRESKALFLGGKAISFVQSLRYLGVVFDSDGGFASHLGNQLASAAKRMGALRTLAAASWGPPSKALRCLFEGLVLSVFRYCGSVWLPTLCEEQRKLIDDVLYDAAKVILGVKGKVNRWAVLCEAEVLDAASFATREAALLYVKARSLPPAEVLSRSLRRPCAWVDAGSAHWASMGMEFNQIMPEFIAEPSQETDIWAAIDDGALEIHEDETTAEEVHSLLGRGAGAPLSYFTDGSVADSRGAFAWVALHGRGPYVASYSSAVPCLCDPFLAEQDGIRSALCDAAQTKPPSVQLFTDSLGNLSSLTNPKVRDPREDDICALITDLVRGGCAVSLRFVRGHAGLRPNEDADRLAGRCRARWLAAHRLGHMPDRKGSLAIPGYLAASWVKLSVWRSLRLALPRRGSQAAALFAASQGHRSPLLQPFDGSPPDDRRVESLFHKIRLNARDASGCSWSFRKLLRLAPKDALVRFRKDVCSEQARRGAEAAARHRPSPTGVSWSSPEASQVYPAQVVRLIEEVLPPFGQPVLRPTPACPSPRVAQILLTPLRRAPGRQGVVRKASIKIAAVHGSVCRTLRPAGAGWVRSRNFAPLRARLPGATASNIRPTGQLALRSRASSAIAVAIAQTKVRGRQVARLSKTGMAKRR